MRARNRAADAPSVCTLSSELCVTVAEVYNYLDMLAAKLGHGAVYTVDERVQPEVAERLRRGRW